MAAVPTPDALTPDALTPDAMTLVTGANGFVGGEIVRQLRDQGVPVRLAVRLASGGADEVAVGDIGPDTDWGAALSGVGCVIHCAARVHQMDDRAAEPLAAFRRVNRDGTAALARQTAAAGVRRLVFLSSIKVHGETTKDRPPFAANDEPDPQDPYGLSKQEAEQALHAIAADTGLEVAVIRPPLVYGPGVRANFARMVSWVARGRPLPFALCRNQRSLVAVTNLASLAIAASRHPAAAGATLLASDGETVSVRDLLRRIGTAYGRAARLFPVPTALLRLAGSLTGQRAAIDRLCDPLVVDGAPTRQLLGWHPPVTMAEALAEMAAAEPAA